MTRYRVGFDGFWQEDFDTEEDAVEWAKAVAEPKRIVYVAQVGPASVATGSSLSSPALSSAKGRKRWRKYRGNFAPW